MNMAELHDKLVKEGEEVSKIVNFGLWVAAILVFVGIVVSIATASEWPILAGGVAGLLSTKYVSIKNEEQLVRLRSVLEAWEAMSSDVRIQLDAAATEQMDKITEEMKNK